MLSKAVCLFLFLNFTVTYAQERRFWKESYQSFNTLSFGISNHVSDYFREDKRYDSSPMYYALNVMSIHQINFWRNFSIGVGLGINRNLNEQFWTVPLIFDFKWYHQAYCDNCTYFFGSVYKNLSLWDTFREGPGERIGVGKVFEINDNKGWILEIGINGMNFFDKRYEGSYAYYFIGIGRKY